MTRITALLRRFLLHRRILATAAAVICVLAIASLASGHQGSTTDVYTAISRIPAGTLLQESLVHKTTVPSEVVPVGALTSPASLVGEMASAPIPAGAIVTIDAFVATSQASPGSVIMPLSVSSEVLAVLKPGDHICLFLPDPKTSEITVARAIRVVTIPAQGSSGLFSASSANVILAEVPETIAAQLTSTGGLGSTTVAIE